MRRSSSRKKPFGFGIFPESETTPEVSTDLLHDQTTTTDDTCAGSQDNLIERKQQKQPSWDDPKKKDYRDKKKDSSIVVPLVGAIGKRGEPLTLAEVLAYERSQGFVEPDDYDEAYEKLKQAGDATYLSELQAMSLPELIEEARKQRIDGVLENSDRTELVFRILRRQVKQNGLLLGEGTLEILPDQFGFLRSSEHHYLSCPDDIYISPSQIRRFGLRKGCTVSGQIRPPKENERYFALLRVEAINHEDPSLLNGKPFFDELTPVHPDRRIRLESAEGGIESRIVDLFVPIGFGQRGLLVSPPGSEKGILIQNLVHGILAKQSDAFVFVLLTDGRPEDVTEMIRQLRGPHCEVIGSTCDETPQRHVQVAEMVLEKAKRMVEYGKDVIIFLDSMTGLAKARNDEAVSSNKSQGGVELGALRYVKKYFGAARKIEEGGSLTILATFLIDSDNPLENAIYEEFKGTGNLEIVLTGSATIDVAKSGTKHEEIFFTPGEFNRMIALRKKLIENGAETVADQIARTSTNSDLLNAD